MKWILLRVLIIKKEKVKRLKNMRRKRRSEIDYKERRVGNKDEKRMKVKKILNEERKLKVMIWIEIFRIEDDRMEDIGWMKEKMVGEESIWLNLKKGKVV